MGEVTRRGLLMMGAWAFAFAAWADRLNRDPLGYGHQNQFAFTLHPANSPDIEEAKKALVIIPDELHLFILRYIKERGRTINLERSSKGITSLLSGDEKLDSPWGDDPRTGELFLFTDLINSSQELRFFVLDSVSYRLAQTARRNQDLLPRDLVNQIMLAQSSLTLDKRTFDEFLGDLILWRLVALARSNDVVSEDFDQMVQASVSEDLQHIAPSVDLPRGYSLARSLVSALIDLGRGKQLASPPPPKKDLVALNVIDVATGKPTQPNCWGTPAAHISDSRTRDV